jgi:pullulanase
MRDALIAGGMKGATTLAWITNQELVNKAETPKIRHGIKGTTYTGAVSITDPEKTVNYVTCHDNYTLVDRFAAAGITDEALAKKMALLSNSIVFTSQGITFMLAGEEFLRTKGGDHNSYQSSYKVNELDYSLKIKHSDMVEIYKKLLSFKQDVDGMHLDLEGCQNLVVNFSSSGNLYSYEIKDTTNNKTYSIYHRNGANSGEEVVVDLTNCELYLSTHDMNRALTNSTIINPFETIIAVR